MPQPLAQCNQIQTGAGGETALVALADPGAGPRLVLILGGQRVWLGAYDKSDVDVSGLVARLDQLERKASGTVTVSVNASAGGTAAVAFPAGRFTAADVLDIGLTKVSSGLAKYTPYASGISATGMTVGIYSGDGSIGTGSVLINWTASVRRP